MSVANLLVPNHDNLYSNSLTTNSLITSALESDSISSKTTDANLVISGNGIGIVQIADALILPTSGGTPAQFNFYEEITLSPTTSGAFVLAYTDGIKLIRCGKIVVCLFKEITSTAVTANNYLIFANGTIPTRFLPLNITGNGEINYVPAAYGPGPLVNTSVVLGLNQNGGISIASDIVPNPMGIGNFFSLAMHGISWVTH